MFEIFINRDFEWTEDCFNRYKKCLPIIRDIFKKYKYKKYIVNSEFIQCSDEDHEFEFKANSNSENLVRFFDSDFFDIILALSAYVPEYLRYNIFGNNQRSDIEEAIERIRVYGINFEINDYMDNYFRISCDFLDETIADNIAVE